MTLEFSSTKNLMDFVRTAPVRNYELCLKNRTIRLDFSQAEADHAFRNFGARPVEDDSSGPASRAPFG